MDLATPLSSAEFLCVDTETNGRNGDDCELTEIGAVLVGGGELHDRWETLLQVRAPLGRGIQRFTGITQAMVDEAPPAELQLPELAELMEGRVLVAHSAQFDVRVLRQAFAREDLDWPDPPTLCTVKLARRLAPLVRQRSLRPLAESLGIEVEVSHRALADAESCARVLCALFGRLCAQAETVAEALALLKPLRARKPRAGRTDGGPERLGGVRKRGVPTAHLPTGPGIYVVRNEVGQPLYVGKSVDVRARVRAHFTASSADASWISGAESVEGEETGSELGALLLEHERIRALKPPGNVRHKHVDGYVYLRARLDIPFPVLEVAPEPAAGRAVNVGPLASRHGAVELMEQLNSLFGLRHCGRTMPKHGRPWPSAYGQMGRCLSPCLGDLDPNLYRRRHDEALGLFAGDGAGTRRVLRHLDAEMRAAAAEQRYERAGWLRRRRRRLAELLADLGGVLEQTGAAPRVLLAAGPHDGLDAIWLAGGRVVDWAAFPAGSAPPDPEELARRSATALRHDGPGPHHLTADDVARARIVGLWEAQHEPEALDLRARPGRASPGAAEHAWALERVAPVVTRTRSRRARAA